MSNGLEFTYDQPVVAVHASGSALVGRWRGGRIHVHNLETYLCEGLEREGYEIRAARGTVIASTTQLQKLPNGTVVMGNTQVAIKEDGKWVIGGYIEPRLSAELWDYLIEITVVHVQGEPA